MRVCRSVAVPLGRYPYGLCVPVWNWRRMMSECINCGERYFLLDSLLIGGPLALLAKALSSECGTEENDGDE